MRGEPYESGMLMLYLESFTFPQDEEETSFIMDEKRTCFGSFYPFKVLSKRRFERIDFEPVTILYGGNGTGKSTALQVIAEKAGLARTAPFNRTAFFGAYVDMCNMRLRADVPKGSCIITSDDVFDHMLRIREMNDGIASRREDMFEEYFEKKRSGFQLRSMEDYEELVRVNRARKRTQSRYVKEELGMDVRTLL